MNIEVKSKLINPGIINDQYPNCISFTYFQGEQIIAYGSLNKVIIITNFLTIIDSLCEHDEHSKVTAVAWTQYSGRLSSCGTDLLLNIWEPIKNGWVHVKTIQLQYIANCISWNFLGTKFCIASEVFSIYDYESKCKNDSDTKPFFTEYTTTNYCAFSRDSRFILTLQKNNQIYIWYQSPTSTTEYRRLILTHPTKVISISWRLCEDVYQRCSFMSITEDGVARIWIETCVMERLSFHVATSIPSPPITAGCFVMSTSKMINWPLKTINTDHYANGNGHYIIRDKNTRYSSVPDPREIERNKSWVLCFHKDMKLSIWELSGLSLSVRSTPKLKRILLINQANNQFLKLEKSFIPKLSYLIATYSKQYRLGEDEDKSKKNNIISVIFEDQHSHTLIATDIVNRNLNNVSVIGLQKGHSSPIKMFRFHDSKPFMISIDMAGTASFWKINDSDVYDPSLLIQFKFTIGNNVQIADFVKNSDQVIGHDFVKNQDQVIGHDSVKNPDQIIGYDGRSIFVVNYDSINEVPIGINQVHSNFKSVNNKIIDLTVFHTDKSPQTNRILFVSLFSDVFYVCYLEKNNKFLYHRQADENDNFVKGVHGYLTTITKNEKIYIYRIATKRKIISIKLHINQESEKPTVYYQCYDIELEKDEEIINIKNSRPATVCIMTQKNIYMGRQLMSKTNSIEILEKIRIDEKVNLNVFSCLPNGFLAIAFKDEIKLYFTGRKSHEFTQSLLSLRCVSTLKAHNVSELEWMDNGILIYSEQCQILALTKFMNTYFLDSNIKLPTIHHSLVSLTFSVPDLHSTVISPLVISGRLNLVSKMLKYFDKHFYEDDCRVVLKKFILNMPPETDKEGKHLCSKKIGEFIESLIEKIKNDNQKIDSKEENNQGLKFVLDQKIDVKTENNRLLYIINKMKSVKDISFDILDKRALVYYRSFILSEKSHIPFDLICCALMSHEKEKLYNMMNLQSWEVIERCGAVYWCDLSKLKETLVSISIRDFNTNLKHLSIFFLVLFKRFRAINHLYLQSGDQARAAFFIRDFSTDKNKKSALNNAYSALSKHDFHISAAMFILAGKYETALTICKSNINDYSLSYLLTCFSDNKTLSHDFLVNVLIKEAKEKNDHAALSLFEHIAYGKEIDLTLRMRQMQPGFLYNDMRIFGDVRFCACEVIKPTIETVRELSRSLLLAGHFFLAAQFADYLSTNIVEEEETNNEVTININDLLSCREFDSDITISIPKTKKENNMKRRFPSSISFQALHNMQEIETYDDDNATTTTDTNSFKREKSNLIRNKEEVGNDYSDEYENDDNEDSDDIEMNENDDNDNDDENQFKIKHRHPRQRRDTRPDFSVDSIFGYSTHFDFDFDYDKDTFSSSEGNEEVEDIIENSDSDVENEFIDNLKVNFQQSLVRSRTLDNIVVHSLPQINNKKKEINDESTEIALLESNKSDSNFNSRLVLFNILRLRLETFLEQSLNLREVEEIIPTLGKEIEKIDSKFYSIHPDLRDFLIRTCKRCSFVYRRILLSDRKSQTDYIMSLCDSLSNLPDLITSTYLTTQQIAQVSHTIWCLTTYFNKKLVGQPLPQMRYIIASIMTGFFVVGCYNMNVELLLTLLEQQNKNRNKYEFPQALIDQIKVEIAVPENISKTKKLFEYNIDAVNFISRKKENVFSYQSKQPINDEQLFKFMWHLFDMMLINEFSLLIEKIQVNQAKFQSFFTSLQKIENLSMQYLIYATLNFPVIQHIESLEKVEISNEKVKKLYLYLLRKNDREKKIYSFCKNLYSQNSDIYPFQIRNVQEKAKLRNSQKVARFKSGITSFCMYKDIIYAATQQGLKQCNIHEFESSENKNVESNESDEMNIDLEEETNDETTATTTTTSTFMSEESLYSTSNIYSSETISLRESDTCPSFLHKTEKYRYFSKRPYLLLSHPTEDYMLATDYQGHAYARKYEEHKLDSVSIFTTKFKTKCSALGFQTTGTMFALAQSSYVSLFSFCCDSYNKPYATYDTYGSSVQSLSFVQGTGIFATCQKPSIDFDANIVFWDSILPPGTAMISSMKVDKVGKPLSICFSPKYKSVIVGTNKGNLILIDTRKYEILKILKNAHEKNIRCLSIDQNESYCVTGGGEGTVKIWDMRSLDNIGEMKNVHSPRKVKAGQKWKTVAITNIHIKNDIIYTSGLDGYIKRIEFS